MRTIAFYKLPRCKVKGVIVYKKKVFTTISEFKTYLIGTVGFTDRTAENILDRLPVVDKDEMESILTSIRVGKDRKAALLAGTFKSTEK